MKRVVFMGTPYFAVPILEALIQEDIEIVLVVTQPDRLVGRKFFNQSGYAKTLKQYWTINRI